MTGVSLCCRSPQGRPDILEEGHALPYLYLSMTLDLTLQGLPSFSLRADCKDALPACLFSGDLPVCPQIFALAVEGDYFFYWF